MRDEDVTVTVILSLILLLLLYYYYLQHYILVLHMSDAGRPGGYPDCILYANKIKKNKKMKTFNRLCKALNLRKSIQDIFKTFKTCMGTLNYSLFNIV